MLLLDLGIFHVGKRVGYFIHWEPIYIGTHADPHYDERLSWEGKSDKMTQVINWTYKIYCCFNTYLIRYIFRVMHYVLLIMNFTY